jgi:hypothetical protein
MRKWFLAISLCAILTLAACGSSGDYAYVPYSSSEYQGLSLQEVLGEFESAGFTNVTTDELSALSESAAGTVGGITVDGSHLFTGGSRYDPDAPVVISYYVVYDHTGDAAEDEAAEPEETADDGELSAEAQATRAEALAVNDQFRYIRAVSEEAYYTFLASVKSNEFTAEVDAYNAASSLNDQLMGYYSQLLDIGTSADLEYYDDYRLAMYGYISDMIEVAKNSMQYFDDGQTSTLSAFQQSVASVESSYDECYLMQDMFLSSAGFSYDEIDEMLGNLEE